MLVLWEWLSSPAQASTADDSYICTSLRFSLEAVLNRVSREVSDNLNKTKFKKQQLLGTGCLNGEYSDQSNWLSSSQGESLSGPVCWTNWCAFRLSCKQTMGGTSCQRIPIITMTIAVLHQLAIPNYKVTSALFSFFFDFVDIVIRFLKKYCQETIFWHTQTNLEHRRMYTNT